jgi:hypothetical protein
MVCNLLTLVFISASVGDGERLTQLQERDGAYVRRFEWWILRSDLYWVEYIMLAKDIAQEGVGRCIISYTRE